MFTGGFGGYTGNILGSFGGLYPSCLNASVVVIWNASDFCVFGRNVVLPSNSLASRSKINSKIYSHLFQLVFHS